MLTLLKSLLKKVSGTLSMPTSISRISPCRILPPSERLSRTTWKISSPSSLLWSPSEETVWRKGIGQKFKSWSGNQSIQLTLISLFKRYFKSVFLNILTLVSKSEKKPPKSTTSNQCSMKCTEFGTKFSLTWLLTKAVHPSSEVTMKFRPLWTNIWSTLKSFSSVHSKNLSNNKLLHGIQNWKWFQMSWKNGWNVKETGCTCSQFSTLETFQNNSQLKVRSSDKSIQCGKPTSILPNSKLKLWTSAVQKDCLLNSRMPMKSLKTSKSPWMNTWRKREKNLPDFISYPTMIFWKFFLRQNNRLQCSLTWKRCLKTFMRLSLITKSTLSLCFRRRSKRWISLIMWIRMRRMLRIGWTKSKKWWNFQCDMSWTNQ